MICTCTCTCALHWCLCIALMSMHWIDIYYALYWCLLCIVFMMSMHCIHVYALHYSNTKRRNCRHWKMDIYYALYWLMSMYVCMYKYILCKSTKTGLNLPKVSTVQCIDAYALHWCLCIALMTMHCTDVYYVCIVFMSTMQID